MLSALALLTSVGAGTIGGVFFAFSVFVMKALGALPASQGIAAMQRINVAVLNPLFLGVFVGTAVLAAICLGAAMTAWSAPRSPWLLAAGLLYLLGCFFVTVAFNVPRNERLARVDAASPEGARDWALYLDEWTSWNHLRTVAALGAAASSAAALSF